MCTNRQSFGEQASQTTAEDTAFPTRLHPETGRHPASALTLAHQSELGGTHERHRPQAGTGLPHPATSLVQASRTPVVPTQTEPQSEQHDLSDASSGSSTVQSILNPPIPGDPAPSVDTLFAWVNSFAKTHGFGVVKAHSMVRPGRWSRCIFQCDRYGTPRPGRGAGLRKRKSRKSGCLWKIVAEALPENDFQWTLRHFPKVEHHQHNHKSSSDAAAHPVHRRITSPVKATVRSTSRRVGIRARDIGGIVRDHFPDSVYTARDIYNARARINRENLGSYNSTAALIKLFDEKGIPYIVKWDSDEPSRLVGLVWTFPYCLRMWKRFSEVISFDNTYNTNRFKLPLFQVTGQTCLGTVFNAAFGLIDNERLEGFQFLATGISTLLNRNSIRVPDVAITDFDDQMKTALGIEFPDAQQQLCIHHINSNVMLQSKRKWVYSTSDSGTGEESSSDEPDAALNQHDQQAVHASARQEEPVTRDNLHQPVPHDYNGVLMLWRLVVFAETEEDHEKAWECLCQQFGDQRAILTYLYGTYMPVRAQWARCFIRKYRNFGIRVTSGTEASNNNIKSYLLNGMSHLYRLVEAIQGMLEDQEREFRQACAQDEVLTAREHVGHGSEYLGELPQVVSKKALALITREHRKALRGIPSSSRPWPDDVGTCNDECNVSFELGVPCHHTIYAKLMAATPLTKWDIHPRWHLREPISRDVYRRILDPKIATSLRGRPKNNPRPVPTRMAVSVSSQKHNRQASSDSQPKRRGQPNGSRNKTTLARVAREATQPCNGQSNERGAMLLGCGNTTGKRASGRRTQPSLRRRRSQWELSTGEGITPGTHGRLTTALARTRAPRRCSRCRMVGHVMSSNICPLRRAELPMGSDSAQEQASPSCEIPASIGDHPSNPIVSAMISQPLSDASLQPLAPTSAASASPPPPSYGSQEAITVYQGYVAARKAWYRSQPRGSIRTNQEYRKAMGLPSRYDEKSYEWCLYHEQMTKFCTTSMGTREWTKEEKMAYLDWSKAKRHGIEVQANAEARCNHLGRRTSGQGEMLERNSTDVEEQDALLSGDRHEQDCITVIP